MTPLMVAAVAAALVPPPVVEHEHEPALPDIAHEIIRCESGGDPNAKNPESSASGLYQFTDGTWTWVTGLEPPARAWPVEVQHQAFTDLWDDGRGWRHWLASYECWGN